MENTRAADFPMVLHFGLQRCDDFEHPQRPHRQPQLAGIDPVLVHHLPAVVASAKTKGVP